MKQQKPTIAVINSSEDTVDMLCSALNYHGFTSVAAAHVPDIRRGRIDFAAFLAEHDPRVLIYDISIPYDENWDFLQALLLTDQMRGRRIVITTTTKRVLDRLVGETGAFEIHGKPYDIEQILAAVERALADEPAASRARKR